MVDVVMGGAMVRAVTVVIASIATLALAGVQVLSRAQEVIHAV
jgi:hypothetical protein